jgi:hypothetical protein
VVDLSPEAQILFKEHYKVLESSLLELRHLFLLNENLSDYRQHFDEVLNANEFEIALHALCDFLLEPTTPNVGLDEINKIDTLHEKMGLNDDCSAALRAKRGVIPE